MKRIPRTALLFFLAMSASLSAHAETPSTPATEAIKPMMQQNLATVIELQRLAVSPESIRNPKNYDQIVRLVDRLAGIAHALPQVTDADRPGLTAVSEVFSEYLSDLKAGLRHGNPVYLRNRIRTAAGFCFECHTSTPTDKTFQDTEKRVEALRLTPFQKAEFLAATRQFDKALETYKSLLATEPTQPSRSTELAQALRNALILAVRVKQDPKLASELLGRVEGREDLSNFFRGQIKAWRKDVSDWKSGKDLDSSDAAPWLAKAQFYVDRAQKLQAYPADHAGDISYLRAITFAHGALARKPDTRQKAHALYLLGAANSVIEDPLLWNLDDYYYEACIETVPHTPLAQQCYDRWLQETTFSYTGSLGTDMPADTKDRAARLGDLAR